MPRKPKAQPAALPAIPAELLEQFGNGPMTAEAINAATLALKKALIERALGGEMNHHLGYPPGAAKPANATNQRNGKGAKTVLTEDGPIRIEVPRDRDGSFEPILIPKHERRFTGFDDKIVAMYARGMTVREIQGFLLEQVGVSPRVERKRSRTPSLASSCAIDFETAGCPSLSRLAAAENEPASTTLTYVSIAAIRSMPLLLREGP